MKKAITLDELMVICNECWEKVDEFCGDRNQTERAIIFAGVRQRLLTFKKPEASKEIITVNAIPEKEKSLPEKKTKKKEPCQDKFDPEKGGKCSKICKKENPEEYQNCLEKFQADVRKKAKAKDEDSSDKKKGRTFDKDFWGFDKTSVTGKINEIVSRKFTSKTEVAEKLGIDSQRVAVHFSNLKKAGFVMKKKKNEEGIVLYKLTKELSE